jgi:uncharacterized lipoprotein NlpE involved in copper resistance
MIKTIRQTIFLTLAIAVISCGQPAKRAHTISETADKNMVAPATDQHNASNSLDWAGVYLGTLPCADCEGIESELTLNQDNTYLLKTRYLGKSEQSFEEKGTFIWNEAGNTITLSEAKNRPTQYFMGENKVIQLDMDGNKITGSLSDNYILKKQ